MNDWVIGVGSVNVGGMDYSGRLVYAMKVTDVLTLREYDHLCRQHLPNKIPNLNSTDYRKKVGDCQYAYSSGGVITQRNGVHDEDHQPTDLSGENALLSRNFYYFGTNAVKIPARFSVLIRQGQNHQSIKNEPVKEKFVLWLEKTYTKNKLYGESQVELIFTKDAKGKWCRSKKCKYQKKSNRIAKLTGVC